MNFDDIANKAKEFAGSHKDQVNDGLGKAGDFVKDKFGASDDQVNQGLDKAKEFLGSNEDNNDQQ